jgi:hypothetical protein
MNAAPGRFGPPRFSIHVPARHRSRGAGRRIKESIKSEQSLKDQINRFKGFIR